LFSPEELERVICGSENLDFKDLEKVVKYEGGFSERTPIIRAFWDILHNFDLQTKKAFLFFVTGSDRAPIRGLSNLKMIIQRESDSENLPCSHTCSSVLLLPEYSCREKLREKLQLALQFKESFGLI
jgi:ubiquitin-protein ligase E3 A